MWVPETASKWHLRAHSNRGVRQRARRRQIAQMDEPKARPDPARVGGSIVAADGRRPIDEPKLQDAVEPPFQALGATAIVSCVAMAPAPCPLLAIRPPLHGLFCMGLRL